MQGSYFRFISDNAEDAASVLRANGFSVEIDAVLSVRLNDSKGKLAGITLALAQAKINLDYVYASVDQAGSSARLILKVENVPMAARILNEMAEAA